VACQYAKRTPTHSSLSPYAQPSSQTGHGDSATNTDLAARVRKLEQLLQTAVEPDTRGVAPSMSTPSAALNDSYLSPASEAPPPSTERLNGSLHTTEDGHQRFIPQSMLWSPDQAQRFETSSASPSSFGLARSSSVEELLAALPSRKACHELVDVYFASFASLFHILHDPTFRQQYACFVEDPRSMPLAWLALLYSLLATAVLALPPDSELLADLSRQSTPEMHRAHTPVPRYGDAMPGGRQLSVESQCDYATSTNHSHTWTQPQQWSDMDALGSGTPSRFEHRMPCRPRVSRSWSP
jgi:hypothetical protein